MSVFKEKDKRSRRTFNLKVDILNKMDEVSKKEKRTKNEIVETALEYLFELIEQDEQKKKEKSE